MSLQKREPERVHAGFKNGYQHLFESLLGGHPIAISLAGSIYANKTLNDLYDTLVKSTILNSLTQGTAGRSLVSNNLTLSLNLSLKLYNDKKIYQFFHMMGYLPGGAREEDIDQIWQQVSGSEYNDWKPFCSYLENASIIVKKKVKQNKNEIIVMQLVPMLKNIAEEYGADQQRNRMHKVVTNYYVQILEEILKENSIKKSSEENEAIMNNLWFFEMNIWDCVYRALEIKKNIDFQRTDSLITEEDISPGRPSFRNKIERGTSKNRNKESSGKEISLRNKANISASNSNSGSEVASEELNRKISNKRRVTDTNLFGVIMVNQEKSKKAKEEDLVLADVLEQVKEQIMPRTTSNDLQDSDVLSFIQKSVMPDKMDNKLIKPKQKITKKKIDSSLGDDANMINFEMAKRLKKTVNKKIANMIKNNEKFNSLQMPRGELYSKLSHKLMEMQEKHKLYKGNATSETLQKGKTMKQVSNDSKILILYLANLILFSKKTDAVKTVDEYGKYFYDKNLCEANLRKLKGLALIRNKKENSFESATEAIKEFLHAKVIFLKHECHHGVGLCCAGVGFVLYDIFTNYVKNKIALLNYAKRTFLESLLHYEAIGHTYGMSYCYDMLHDIKRSIGEDCSEEHRRYTILQNKILNDIENDKSTFLERYQGVEMSLFIENVMSVYSSSTLPKHTDDNVDEVVSTILERKKMVEAMDQANEKELKNHMTNFFEILSDYSSEIIRGKNTETNTILENTYAQSVSANDASKLRNSLNVRDKASLTSILTKIPQGMKVRDKIKSKLRETSSGIASPIPNNNFLK